MESDKIKEIIDRLNTCFVDDFILMKESKDKVNNYLILLNISELYDYNTFCTELISVSNEILEKITDEEFGNISVDLFISDILAEMLINRIIKCDMTESEKAVAIIKIELDRYMTKNPTKR